MVRILLAEDDVAIGRAIRDGLEAEGFTVTPVKSGTQVLPALAKQSYGILLLDLMLPGLDGIEVCREIRRQRMTLPILMLTARDRLDDRVTGLNSGADDYLTKPFEFPELVARVRALLRRHHLIKSAVITFGNLTIDTVHKVAKIGEDSLGLTPREFSLLEALAQNAGAVLSKDMIAERVWLDEFTTPNTVEVHVKNLRRKLEEKGEAGIVQTIHGMGYSLRMP